MPAPTDVDREAVEALLPWNLRAALPDICRAWGFGDIDQWPAHPLLRDWLVLTAVQVLAARNVRRGASKTAGLRAACESLGQKYRTVYDRLRQNRGAFDQLADAIEDVDGIPVQTARIAR